MLSGSSVPRKEARGGPNNRRLARTQTSGILIDITKNRDDNINSKCSSNTYK
jgi:hypothetical protein